MSDLNKKRNILSIITSERSTSGSSAVVTPISVFLENEKQRLATLKRLKRGDEKL